MLTTTSFLLVVLAVNFVHAKDEVVEKNPPLNETETEPATDATPLAERRGPEPPPSTG